MIYRSFRLRVWKEEGKTNPNPWRMTVENSDTGTRIGFTDWESLLAYLDEQTKDTLTEESK